jgi:hypothetical protein
LLLLLSMEDGGKELLHRKDRQLDNINRIYCRLRSLELADKNNEQSKSEYMQYTNFGDRLSEKLLLMGATTKNQYGGYVSDNIIGTRIGMRLPLNKKSQIKQKRKICSTTLYITNKKNQHHKKST